MANHDRRVRREDAVARSGAPLRDLREQARDAVRLQARLDFVDQKNGAIAHGSMLDPERSETAAAKAAHAYRDAALEQLHRTEPDCCSASKLRRVRSSGHRAEILCGG